MWTYVSGGSQITKEVANVRYWEPNGLGSEATEGQLMNPLRTYFSVRFCAAVGRITDVSDQIARQSKSCSLA